MSAVLRASAITGVALRVAGEIPVAISANHVGTPEQEACLHIGELLLYVRDPAIAHRAAETCAQARTLTAALPHLVGASRLHLPVRVGVVGVFVRLAGVPDCTAASVPGRPGVAVPPHVRLEVGPVAFEVCDQIAWQGLRRAWTVVRRQLMANHDH